MLDTLMLKQWVALVDKAPERTNLLHYFNTVRESRFDDGAFRSKLWEEFDKFLLDLVNSHPQATCLADVVDDPTSVLKKFASKEIGSGADKRYVKLSGGIVHATNKKLCSQQTLGGFINRAWKDEMFPLFKVLFKPVELLLKNQPAGSGRQKYAIWLREVREAVALLTEQLNSPNMFPDEDWEPNLDAARNFSSDIMWLTFKEELDRLINPGCLRPGSMTASYLMAKQRYLTGLFYGDDTETESTFFDRVSKASTVLERGTVIQFKTLLSVAFSTSDDFECNQPTMFSETDPKLFVSEPHDEASGGKTCRLKNDRCGHQECQCFGVGLPEMVGSIGQLMANSEPYIVDMALMDARHLNRNALPTVTEIESKRAGGYFP